MGAIADRAKAYIPFTWDGLSKAPQFGTAMLQGRVDRAKYEVLGATAPVEVAEAALPENQIEHIAKRSVVKIIPAGIEFWTNQPITQNTTGTHEVISYESRVQELRLLYARLQQEIVTEEPTVTTILQTTGIPAVSDGQSDILVTVNPHDFPPAFGTGQEEV